MMETAPRTAPNIVKMPSLYRTPFQHRGRSYTIFKRKETRNSPYYVHVQRDGKRHKVSLETPDQRTAIARAKLFLNALFEDKWDVLKGGRQTPKASTVTLSQVISIYQREAVISPRTVRNNILALRQVVRRVFGDVGDTILLSKIDASVAHRFQRFMVSDYAQAGGDVRETTDRALRSSKSLLNQARSLFCRSMPRIYQQHGITLPESVFEFTACRLDGSLTNKSFTPPPDDLWGRIFDSVADLKTSNRDAFLAFWFAAGAGLRRGEIARLQWEHVTRRDGRPWICGGIGKNGKQIDVPIQDRAWKAIAPLAAENGPVMGAGGVEWARTLNGWLGKQGLATRKKLHELRAYVGSLIYRENPAAAKRFLRHHSVQVTERFYLRYGEPEVKEVL